MYAKKGANAKLIAALLAIALLIGCGIGGTIAWLMDTTKEVQNTFTVGNINIDLKETVNGQVLSAKNVKVNNDQFTIIPGTTQTKDPKVIVAENSEDCYVFVRIDDSNTTFNNVVFVDWKIAEGWTKLEGAENAENVYYLEYTGGERKEYSILKNDQVSYPSALTKAQIDAFLEIFDEPSQAKPSLTFAAYAVQMVNGDGNFTAAEAWAELNKG